MEPAEIKFNDGSCCEVHHGQAKTPPNTPGDLSATVSGQTVSLGWKDLSADETGFRILRRDTLTGGFHEIATTASDTNTYKDTIRFEGEYWYRIIATNGEGDSFGSNLVKVTVAW